MAGTKRIKTALISVFHKDGLDDLLKKLDEEGVQFLSTGGTQQFIESLGYEMPKGGRRNVIPFYSWRSCEDFTSKDLCGILARRDNEEDQKQMVEYTIPAIDLVIVDLYPFEQTVASGASAQDIIEKIDIGGISLIRAGAKNFKDVVIVPSKAEYPVLLQLLNTKGAETDIEDRKMFAERAFGVSSHL